MTLDFWDVWTISPSFVNRLLLNLLHRVSATELEVRVRFAGTSPHVRQAIDRALARHVEHSIKLTAYLPA